MTSIKDDGAATITVTDEDNTFFEGVVLKGRETHLLDDLEYTKAALAIESITKPLVGALKTPSIRSPRRRRRRPNDDSRNAEPCAAAPMKDCQGSW